MIATFDNTGRIMVTGVAGPLPLFYDTVSHKYCTLEPTTEQGIVTSFWRELPSMANGQYTGLNQVDGKYYTLSVTTDNGQRVSVWTEVV
jgi:hypothetical protein